MAQTILILEGVDGAGKTTMAKALSSLIDIPFYKPSVAGFEQNRETRLITGNGGAALASYLKQTGQSVIFDRNYPSEWVYSQVFSRPMDERAIWELDRLYADMGAVIIHFQRDNSAYQGYRFEDLTPAQIMEAQTYYYDFLEKTACQVVTAPSMRWPVYERANMLLEQLVKATCYA